MMEGVRSGSDAGIPGKMFVQRYFRQLSTDLDHSFVVWKSIFTNWFRFNLVKNFGGRQRNFSINDSKSPGIAEIACLCIVYTSSLHNITPVCCEGLRRCKQVNLYLHIFSITLLFITDLDDSFCVGFSYSYFAFALYGELQT